MDAGARADTVRARLSELLQAARLDPGDGDAVGRAAELAGELAMELLTLARRLETQEERHAERRLARLMGDEAGRRLTVAFTDQALRPRRAARVADQLRYLLRREGIPSSLSAWERALLKALRAAGGLAPSFTVARVLARLEAEVAKVTLPASEPGLTQAIAATRARGARVNLNHLGEAILGDAEARERHAAYLATLRRADVDAVSVKVSSVVAQLDVLGWERALALLEGRLGEIYRVAGETLVTLDMEEYRDLELTFELLARRALTPEHLQVRAGVVLQAYLPDGVPTLERLIALSARRVAAGGRPLRLRLVKGANLAMERVDASLLGYVQAPYESKAEVDANFKRMMVMALGAARRGALEVGLGSHNLFDLALGLALRAMWGVEAAVGFEMLHGIAPSLQRALAEVAGDLLVYSPTVDRRDLLAAIAYLIRRLDENAGADNFLRESFGMTPGSPAFERERLRFVRSVATREAPRVGSRRAASGLGQPHAGAAPGPGFTNTPDTDWTLPSCRAWIEGELRALAGRLAAGPILVRPSVGGAGGVERHEDPSRPAQIVAEVALASPEAVAQVVGQARAAVGWGGSTSARAQTLRAVAERLRGARGELIALMVAEAAKSVLEGDAELSEAIDFAGYYAASAESLEIALAGAAVAPRGVVVVAPPWNFPLAIPAGGVLAALVAGNAVILKPAPETCATAQRLCELMWEAGVPREALSFLPCANEPTGSALIMHPAVDTVILTGGTATARRMLAMRPDLRLIAETGGKNAMIATDMADRDLVIRDVLRSAFYHAGQKCSATSLLILEAPLYDDARFLERLSDAVRSLHVGSAWELGARVTPLIREPTGDLAWALTQLEPGERWLVEPKVAPDNPRLWSPGVKLGVREGSRTHQRELFGPVLGVMRADDLAHALRLANAVPYGLTAGLQTLDEREQAAWAEAIDAGCLYINRATTGAIVRRQPFGGRKASVFGPGAKAGGPNYVLQLLEVVGGPEGLDASWLGEVVDPSRILGQDNLFRYRPTTVHVRLGAGAAEAQVTRLLAAQRAVAAVLGGAVSLSAPAPEAWHSDLGLPVRMADAAAVELDGVRRLRAVGAVEPALRAACHERAIHYEVAPPATARVELLRWVEEQTVSVDTHRFGHLGARSRAQWACAAR